MMHIMRLLRGFPRLVALLGGACLGVAWLPAAADEPALPRSLAEAVRMERADALPRTPFYETPALTDTKPGGLLRKAQYLGYAEPVGARAVRILYHSLSADGGDVATSGVVLVPAGTPPPGGWPVIAWAHGTTGVARMCAPSLQKPTTDKSTPDQLAWIRDRFAGKPAAANCRDLPP
jgi:hypothetical protein